MTFRPPTRLIRATRIVGWLTAFGLALVLLQSAFWAQQIPVPLKLAVVGMLALAAVRPADALLVFAFVAPFGHALVTRVWEVHTFALSEALALAFLAGYLWSNRTTITDGDRPPSTLGTLAWLFALVIGASCIVQVVELQHWHNYPSLYVPAFFRFLTTEYLVGVFDPRPWVDGRLFVSAAALLIEGIGLLLCTRTLVMANPALPYRLTNTVVGAGAIAAIMSVWTLTAAAARNQQSISALIESSRWAPPTIPSLNTAAGYFLLVGIIAFGSAALSRRHLLFGIAAGLSCVTAMWLTQTRSAMVGGAVALIGVVAWRLTGFGRAVTRSRIVAAAAIFIVTTSILVVFYNPLELVTPSAALSLRYRFQFAQTSLRMYATEPVFGVGVGRYVVTSASFSSAELLDRYDHSEAHNNFLWIAAELGTVGLVIFLLLTAVPLVSGLSELRRRGRDWWLAGVLAALIGFIVTWLSWQPLSVPLVAYTFWILLGTLAGIGGRSPSERPTMSRWPLIAPAIVAATVVLVVDSIPLRAARAVDQVDLSRVKYGFYNLTGNRDVPSRWAGPDFRFYLRSTARSITVPLSARHPGTPNGANIEIRVNGATVQQLQLGRQWRDVALAAPASEAPYWHVDVHVDPIGVPEDTPVQQRRIAVGEVRIESE